MSNTNDDRHQHLEPDLKSGDYLKETEAAAVLAVAVKTLRNWRSRGQGPRFVKVGRRMVRYHRADIN